MLNRVVALALIALAVGAGVFFARNADVLAIRLPTRALAPTGAEVTTPRGAVEHFQCNRCHVVAGVDPPSARLNENCVTCHQAIRAGRLDRWYGDANAFEWREHLVHLLRTPDLDTLGRRVTRDWFVAFVQAPHVVRPLYGATMPRLRIDARQAELLADFFHVTERAAAAGPARGDAERGAALLAARGCAACHARGDSRDLRYGAPEFRASASAVRGAPDLAFVSRRMSLPQLRAWLTDPRSVLPETEMPAPGFSGADLDDVIAFLWQPVPGQPPLLPRAPRLLDRKVRYAEVAQKLSRHLCFHCHSDSARAGDLGPGNSGGFGYAGVGLDLASRAGILRGVRRDGRFQGQPDRLPDGVPRLVASLLARRAELHGASDGGVLGMPLGFPPLPDDDIDLVFTWLEQGAAD